MKYKVCSCHVYTWIKQCYFISKANGQFNGNQDRGQRRDEAISLHILGKTAVLGYTYAAVDLWFNVAYLFWETNQIKKMHLSSFFDFAN